MNLEAIQKAYAALEKDGVLTSHLGPLSIDELSGGENVIRFSSEKIRTLVSVLVEELDFRAFRSWSSMYVGLHIIGPFYDGPKILTEGQNLFDELISTAKCFI